MSSVNCPCFELPALVLNPKDCRAVLECLIHTILFHRFLGPIKPRDVSSDVFPNIRFLTCSHSTVLSDVESSIESVSQTSARILESQPQTSVEISFYQRSKKKSSDSSFSDHHHHSVSAAGSSGVGTQSTSAEGISSGGSSSIGGGSSSDSSGMSSVMGWSLPSSLSSALRSPAAKEYWEVWRVPLKKETSVRLSELEPQVQAAMLKVMELANQRLDHSPPLPKLEGLMESPVCYPFEIRNPDDKDKSHSIPSALNKMFEHLLKNPPTVLHKS